MEFKWLNESAINKTGDRWEITAPKESDFFVIILKESIRFRAVKKEQLMQKINCSECDSFQLYQSAEL